LIHASIFVILTDVDGAYLDFGTSKQELIKEVTTGRLQRYLDEGQFKEGSMAPKVLAAIRFVESGGERAIIAELGKLTEALEGKAGTHVVGPRA
jgi:carbamate kinase